MVSRKRETGRIRSVIRSLALSSVLVSIVGCISASAKFDRVARESGLNKVVTSGRGFQHAIYEKGEPMLRTGSLNVYLGSDGTPWVFNVPSRDPTPRNPMILRLMVQDPQAAILVGRPCYHGLAGSRKCNQSLWTSGRYSRKVVASIAKVIEQYVDKHAYRSITLIGYSGGGTLATLVAAQLKQVDMVLTVAANLDTEAWASHHNYEPLSASVNPADEPPLPKSIRQVHFFGTLDSIVPVSTTERYFSANSTAERREIAEFDHICCWEKIWQSLLAASGQTH